MSSDSRSLTDLKPGVYKFIRTIGTSTMEVYLKVNGQSALMVTMEENPKLKRLLRFVDIRLVPMKHLKDILVDWTEQEPISHNIFSDMYVKAINRLNAAVEFQEFDLIRKKDASNYVVEDAYGYLVK